MNRKSKKIIIFSLISTITLSVCLGTGIIVPNISKINLNNSNNGNKPNDDNNQDNILSKDDLIKIAKSFNPKINEKGKEIYLKDVDKNNISDYVNDLPKNGENYTVTLNSISQFSENGIILKYTFTSTNNIDITHDYAVDGFKIYTPEEVLPDEIKKQLEEYAKSFNPTITNTGKQTYSNNVTKNFLNKCVDNLPVSNNGYNVKLLNKTYNQTLLNLTYEIRKDNYSFKYTYNIDGFLNHNSLPKPETNNSEIIDTVFIYDQDLFGNWMDNNGGKKIDTLKKIETNLDLFYEEFHGVLFKAKSLE